MMAGLHDQSGASKAYWITCYRSITDVEKFAAYARLAKSAIEEGGGRFLARDTASHAFELGQMERTVIVEFGSLAQALAAHDGEAYQAALTALGSAAARDVRMVRGVGSVEL